jgi:hypothetical protein
MEAGGARRLTRRLLAHHCRGKMLHYLTVGFLDMSNIHRRVEPVRMAFSFTDAPQPATKGAWGLK